MDNPTTDSAVEEVVISRIIDAPRQRVFEAWADPDQMIDWWGPSGFTAPVCEIDFRVGGKHIMCMRSPEGKDYWNVGTYREIKSPERIVYTESFTDENGNVVPATYYGMSADISMEMLVTVVFEYRAGQTEITVHHLGIPAGEDHNMCQQGWSETLDKFAEYLADEDGY